MAIVGRRARASFGSAGRGSSRRGSAEPGSARLRSALRGSGQRGSATAELAVGLPAVVLVLLAVLVVGSAAVAQVQCTDAARAAARAAALGEDTAAVVAIATELAGDDAQVSVAESAGWVRVVVTRSVTTGWLGGSLTATAEFAVPLEPDDP